MGKIISRILLPVYLFLVGVVVSQWFYGEVYVTAIQVHHESHLSKDFFEGPLVAGKVLRGEVVAAYNNFGTLKLRINTYNRINYDKIHFRLREKGHTNWEVENAYIVDVFKDKLMYGFGFPPIRHSNGRTYEFELQSENGTPDDAIGFRSGYHSLASQYVFTRDSLLSDQILLLFFLKAKILSLIMDPYFMLYYGMFFIPIILFPLLLFTNKKYTLYGLEIGFFAYMTALYIFLPIAIHQDTIVYIFLVVVLTLILNIYPRRFTATHAFAIPIGLLVLLELHIFLGNDLESTRVATGIFYSIVLALIIANQELLRSRKNNP